jgi:5-methylcytosine-specific restriction endonuclease McrA
MKQFHISSILKTIEQKPPILSQSQPIEEKRPKRRRGKKQQPKPQPQPQPKPQEKTYKKQKIPVALREQVWIHKMGRSFEGKCPVTWCQNKITVFDFQSGHNIPESRGGKTDLENLVPLCSRCNVSMGNQYTIDEWCKMSNLPEKINTVEEVTPTKKSWFCCC